MKKIVVMMTHSHKNGSKVLPKCTLPLTGKRVVDTLVTDLGMFTFSSA